MGDVYQHPVFFECRGLDGAQRRKVERYFRNRRKSGGGECGALSRVTERVYCIAFKHREDQHNVLQRLKHEVAGCSLVVTDQGPVEPFGTCSTSTASQQYTPSPPVPVSNPSSSGENEQRPDTLPLEATNRTRCQVEDSQRDSQLRERQTSTYQMGESKLHLLWREIYHSVGREFPGVKVSQGDPGHLVLEGPMEEIRMVVDLVSNMENLVLERTVSDMGPHLSTFLKKAYGGPGVLAGVLELGNEVVIELGHIELYVFSLSADKLDQAQKSMQSEFKEVKLDVPNCSAAPELQEKLKSKTNEMNRGQCRAQAVFISDSAVCLLGHSKEVEELTEIVSQFILEEPTVQRTFHGSSQTVKYCRRSSKPENVPKEEKTVVASYSLCDGLQVLVCRGDITKLEADALVNAANEFLDHSGGVAAALSRAGGPDIQKESKALVQQTGKIRTGGVVVTTGGNLKCKKLLHAVGPKGGKAGGREKMKLKETVTSSLHLADMMEFKSIAIPCISSGVSGVPVAVCSEALVTAVKEFGSQGGRSLSKIILIDNREEVVRALHDACDRILQDISGGNCDVGTQNGAAAQNTAGGATTGGATAGGATAGGATAGGATAGGATAGGATSGGATAGGATAGGATAGGATAGAPQDGVHVEILQGTIETQQVEAVVSPMVGHNPLSTRVGNTLSRTVGKGLTARFRKETEEETFPGDYVLVGDLAGQPFRAVFLLHLTAWDGDQDGTAVEVLKLAINNTLTSCEQRGFSSVALPLLGTGIALGFPDCVVAKVLLEQIHAFQQNRVSRTPFLVHIVIHPNEKESAEVFSLVQEAFKDVHQPDQRSTPKRIVLLGKTGTGKSSLANTIFGENLFTVNHSPNSGTIECQSETRVVDERSITLIDTPGLFDTGRSEKEVDREIVNCITECAPGPHAFLILLKVEKFTEQEKAVISKICGHFSPEALKYAVVVFTHGEQLDEGVTIEDFVRQNESLSELVQKCGGRCHVFDNKNWTNTQQRSYRCNQFQVEELLNTVDKLVSEHSGGYYTNEMLQKVEEAIQKEEVKLSGHMRDRSTEEIRNEAKRNVSKNMYIKLAGATVGTVVGAFLGVKEMVKLFMTHVKKPLDLVKGMPSIGKAVAGVVTGDVVLGLGIGAGVAGGVTGGVLGGMVGYDAADEAETFTEAIEKSIKAVTDKSKAASEGIKKLMNQ